MTKNFTQAILDAKAAVIAEKGNEDIKRIILSDTVINTAVETLFQQCLSVTGNRDKAVTLVNKSLTTDMLNTFRYVQHMHMLPFDADIDDVNTDIIKLPKMTFEQASTVLSENFDELNPLILDIINNLNLKNKQFAESMIPYECANMAIEVIRHSNLEPSQAIMQELKPYIEKLSELD